MLRIVVVKQFVKTLEQVVVRARLTLELALVEAQAILQYEFEIGDDDTPQMQYLDTEADLAPYKEMILHKNAKQLMGIKDE